MNDASLAQTIARLYPRLVEPLQKLLVRFPHTVMSCTPDGIILNYNSTVAVLHLVYYVQTFGNNPVFLNFTDEDEAVKTFLGFLHPTH
jgi:hypothetical protein